MRCLIVFALLGTVFGAPTCEDSQYIADQDCTVFWQCSNGVPVLQKCPAGLYFNPELNVCDWPEDSGCVNSDSQSVISSTVASDEEQSTATCETQQYLPGPNCSSFYECSNDVPYLQLCPENLEFNPIQNVCDYPEAAGCTIKVQSSTEASSTSEEISTEDSKPIPITPPTCGDKQYMPGPNCSSFWQCSNGVPYLQLCPKNLEFNPILNVCDYPEAAGCKTSGKSTNVEVLSTTELAITESVNKTTCGDNQYLPGPNCSSFYECSNGVPYLQLCPENLEFNPIQNVCDYPEAAGCTIKVQSSIEASSTSEEISTEDSEPTPITPPTCGDKQYMPGPNCSSFWQCSNGVPYLQLCPANLDFNPVLNVCDWSQNAGCRSQSNENSNENSKEWDESEETSEKSNESPEEGSNESPEMKSLNPPICGDEQYIADEDCTVFWQCSNGVPYLQKCPSGLNFNPKLNVCDWPENAGCQTTEEIVPSK